MIRIPSQFDSPSNPARVATPSCSSCCCCCCTLVATSVTSGIIASTTASAGEKPLFYQIIAWIGRFILAAMHLIIPLALSIWIAEAAHLGVIHDTGALAVFLILWILLQGGASVGYCRAFVEASKAKTYWWTMGGYVALILLEVFAWFLIFNWK